MQARISELRATLIGEKVISSEFFQLRHQAYDILSVLVSVVRVLHQILHQMHHLNTILYVQNTKSIKSKPLFLNIGKFKK